jgi:hypothetical protein
MEKGMQPLGNFLKQVALARWKLANSVSRRGFNPLFSAFLGRKKLNQNSFGNLFGQVAWGRRRTCNFLKEKKVSSSNFLNQVA